MDSISFRVHVDWYIQMQNAFPVFCHFTIWTGALGAQDWQKSAKPCPWCLWSMRSGDVSLVLSVNTRGTYFLRISDRGDVINKQCDLGNLYCSMAQQKKPDVFKDLRLVSRIQLWLDVSGLLIWKMGVLDRIDLSCSLLWGRYEMIKQQKFMEHHFCATGDPKINEQNTSLWSSRKHLALEEESTLGICFRGDMHESLKATERQCTLPEGSLSSWMETRFVNTQVSYYEALRSRWIHINTQCHYNYYHC